MKMKTSELTGAALDWAVASIEKLSMDLLVWEYGLPVVKRTLFGHIDTLRCEFSTNWTQGGPIIEREKIGLWWAELVVLDDGEELGGHWYAESVDGDYVRVGPTPLIAAMRCFVASRLGDEIDVPGELQ